MSKNKIEQNESKLQAAQKTRRSVAIGVGLIAIGLVIALILPDDLFGWYFIQRPIGGIVFLWGVLRIINIYLKGGFEISTNIVFEAGVGNSVTMIDKGDGLTKETIDLIISKDEGKYIELLDFIEKSKQRIKTHIETLSRNSNLNLLIGLGTTIVAVCILTYFIFGERELPKEMPALIAHYISRIAIVIFIEIFALFFLRLYRTNLFEIKFFHNELSNFETKIISLKTALLINDNQVIKEVVSELVKTERNFIIKSGETTIELERAKLDKDDKQSFVDNLVKVMEKSK